MEAMTDPTPPSSNASLTAVAWKRYWRMMRWMVGASIAAVVAALLYLHLDGGLLSVHMVIATAAGVGFTVLLAAALMLLAFMSSGTGHDDDVAKTGAETEAETKERP